MTTEMDRVTTRRERHVLISGLEKLLMTGEIRSRKADASKRERSSTELKEKLAEVRVGTYDHTLDPDEAFLLLAYAENKFIEDWQFRNSMDTRFLTIFVPLSLLPMFLLILFLSTHWNPWSLDWAQRSLLAAGVSVFSLYFLTDHLCKIWNMLMLRRHGACPHLLLKYQEFLDLEIIRRQALKKVDIEQQITEKNPS